MRSCLNPIGPIHRVEPHPSDPGMYLQPVAVVLDLVHLAIAAGRLLGHGRTAGMNEAGGTFLPGGRALRERHNIRRRG